MPSACSCSTRPQGDALVEVDPQVNRLTDARTQRRMGARLQSAVADLHLKVDRLAEEHLLIDASLPDVLALGPRFGKLDIFWPHRKDQLFARLQRFDRPDLHFAERRAHA